ncbi:UNVERIFIED_CONTAM: hypothetical protein H355_005403 [Colinus virginianus]|nr:hypothetical protein H355_005403 [Colinus virginianus]
MSSSEREQKATSVLVDFAVMYVSSQQLKKQLNSVNKALGEEKKKQRQQQQQAKAGATGEVNGVAGDASGGKGVGESREAELLQEALHIRDVQLPSAAAAAATAERQRETLLHRIGNILSPTVPVALCESKNAVLRTWGTPLPEVMARAAELKDFEETLYRIPHSNAPASNPPAGACKETETAAAAATAAAEAGAAGGAPPQPQQQQEGGDGDKDDMFLIATAEQPLCALHRGQVLEEKQLPIRYAGYSSCFRKEAGAHGKDCWGIFRVHQFEKVEQFCLCAPEDSWRVHDEMLAVAEEFYQTLELPYRLVSIVSGALNDAAAKKCDLEAWFPAYGGYRELVSCSNCTDYQSRALDIRMQRQKAAAAEEQHKAAAAQRQQNAAAAEQQQHKSSGGEEKTGGEPRKQLPPEQKPFVHMLNGTLVATQRCVCCILENYQTPTGVKVPRVLQPYMGGVDFLPYVQAADDFAEKKQHKREV